MSSERIVRYTIEELQDLRQIEDRTDWARLRAEEAAGLEPELDEEEIGIEWDWDNVKLVIPPIKKAVSVRLDQDVIEFFKAQGPGYQTRMNAVLQAYMQVKKELGQG